MGQHIEGETNLYDRLRSFVETSLPSLWPNRAEHRATMQAVGWLNQELGSERKDVLWALRRHHEEQADNSLINDIIMAAIIELQKQAYAR